MDTLTMVQTQLKPWQEHNFPDRPSWQPLLGAGEELGELNHAFLKRAQDIRGPASQHTAAILDAVADTMIFLLDFCNSEGIDARQALERTWMQVRERNWRPEKGELPQEVRAYDSDA